MPIQDEAVSQESADEAETAPFYFTPNRQRIIVAGRCARAEQARLEREYRLQDGRRRAKNGDPGGIFR